MVKMPKLAFTTVAGEGGPFHAVEGDENRDLPSGALEA